MSHSYVYLIKIDYDIGSVVFIVSKIMKEQCPNIFSFKQRYGEDVSIQSHVNTPYLNVLGRDYDQASCKYWKSDLNNGFKTNYELLLGFSEPSETKDFFLK